MQNTHRKRKTGKSGKSNPRNLAMCGAGGQIDIPFNMNNMASCGG